MPDSQLSDFIQRVAVYAIPAIFAITLHEVGHGWMARRLGDRTAEMMGRLTLNPLKHIDPLGTVIVPLLSAWLGGVMFGWAKPVPIGVRNLHNPKKDMIAVALAGPGANLAMAYAWALLLGLLVRLSSGTGVLIVFIVEMAKFGILINILLMILNLVPIPPLDGGRVLRGFVSERFGARLDAVEPYGIIIVFGLLMMGPLWKLLWPIIVVVRRLVLFLAGL